ncbi:DNA replication and repair protein recF [Spirochaeta thermophila DSM 6578]|uniref:DNA replication and repair protein RecF n=1 Tax=Winmispira thermophila (strain ATCC 700085 / DSM 6578 / Z-1203) TaxID=869211 RepID=G0GAY8_WINT7|nr:DNA replication and repair protein RecF [Spirochaeta thermophila]AEJ60290.1 DNA replication and repair protein recF [Spirochaeta thermophila DSM 6578]
MFLTIGSEGFRNIVTGTIDVGAPVVVFVGENGQGKTNILELVYLLCYGVSFRTRQNTVLITRGRSSCRIHGEFRTEEGYILPILVEIGPTSKEIFLNEKKIANRKELFSISPCIVFAHDDIQFVVGSPLLHRQFMNQILTLVDPLFLDSLRTYNRILTSRNEALKEAREDLLEVYDDQLADIAHQITVKRERMMDAFSSILRSTCEEFGFSGNVFDVSYRPSLRGDGKEELMRILRSERTQDLMVGFTRRGPHRDRLVFTMNGHPVPDYASTGEIRLLSLLLRVAQTTYVRESTGKTPILLFDDVLLELDPLKRRRVVEMIPHGRQSFFTFLPEEPILQVLGGGRSLVYHVVEGRIFPDETSQ